MKRPCLGIEICFHFDSSALIACIRWVVKCFLVRPRLTLLFYNSTASDQVDLNAYLAFCTISARRHVTSRCVDPPINISL